MWQPGWPMGPGGGGGGGQSSDNGLNGGGPDNWAMVAQQWMKNKEFMEQWQQHQYQQHLQMVASAHATAMSTIDMTVIHNPPPPPPPPETATSGTDSASGANAPNLNTSTGSNSNDANDSAPLNTNGSGAGNFDYNNSYNSPSTLKKPSFLKSRFSNSPMYKAVAAASQTNSNFEIQNDTKPKPLFAAYEQFKVKINFRKSLNNLSS
jgi:hypothetical protein